MSELIEKESELEREQALDGGSAALSLALDGARHDPALRKHIGGFLKDQRALIADQRKHLHEQLPGLKLKHFSDRLRVTLQLLTILVGVMALAIVFWMGWRASRADGVVIEAFSTPPDLAQRGLTGQVIASQLQDKLSNLQAQTSSGRPAASYSNDWGREIKVEIPETGVSLGELDRYLRRWLGHETVVGGEVFRTPAGLRLSIRSSGQAGDSVDGTEADMDGLLSAAALVLYRKTQPYRWAVYEGTVAQRPELAAPVLSDIVANGPPVEKAWALNGLANEEPSLAKDLADIHEGIGYDPDLAILHFHVMGSLTRLGRMEEARAEALKTGALLQRPDHGGYAELGLRNAPQQVKGRLAADIGDFNERLTQLRLIPVTPTNGPGLQQAEVAALVALHRLTEARAARPAGDDAELTHRVPANAINFTTSAGIARAGEDWPEAFRQLSGVDALVRSAPADLSRAARRRSALPTEVWPDLAVAMAHTGRLAEAQALIGKTPLDCYPCLRRRAEVAELSGDVAGADRWYAEAVRQAPSLNTAQIEWGQSLLRRGQPDRAIVQFEAAAKMGPRAGDAWEGWGEALAAKGDLAGAAKKYAEAAKYVPAWGRLHLKWAQALAHLGQRDAARAQLAAAAHLDLTVAEQAEVERLRL